MVWLQPRNMCTAHALLSDPQVAAGTDAGGMETGIRRAALLGPAGRAGAGPSNAMQPTAEPTCFPHNTCCLQALMRGEWKQAYDTLAALPCWALLGEQEQVLAMLHQKLREQGLLVYLHAYSTFYHSMSHQHLMSLFELPAPKVRVQCELAESAPDRLKM